MNDCKTCRHGEVLYAKEKADRFEATYAPINCVRCRAPRYRGRTYFCKATRKACAEYVKRVRVSTRLRECSRSLWTGSYP